MKKTINYLSLKNILLQITIEVINDLYKIKLSENDILINQTKAEFEGLYTIVLFALSKKINLSPQQLGKELGNFLIEKHSTLIEKYNIEKGFLNLSIYDNFYLNFLQTNFANPQFGKKIFHAKKIIVEYSSPNTNKPLHLGHLRNNFLGYSIGKIYEWNGYDVFYTCVVNDRGVHICKSMLAWQKWGNNTSPESVNQKGDHFVGEYYVKFSTELKIELENLKQQNVAAQEKDTVLMQQTQALLQKWEQNDTDTINLWKKMNAWVYAGFDITYKKIGTLFNKIYYESNTYLLGKDLVKQGLQKNIFYQKDDNSIWVNLENEGLDHKLLLRADGTSVYITQDLGLAQLKYDDFKYEQSIYVVGDEQNYHFNVLKAVLLKLNKEYAPGIYHLSYGMIELTTGKMKSREGSVVDADDIIKDMVGIAKQHTIESGKIEGLTENETNILCTNIGMAALKYYLLKIEPKKRIVFNPAESIEFHGHTGPFIQYTYARICSILTKVQCGDNSAIDTSIKIEPLEKEILFELEQFTNTIEQALQEHNPSLIANYAYGVSKKYNSFYSQHSIIKTENENIKDYRIKISVCTKNILHNCASILGFNLPEKM